jgi:hypothetical protein
MASPTQDPKAQDAGAPAQFANKSPFRKKGKKKDPLGAAAMAVGSIALVVSVLAIGLAMMMSASG